MPIILSWDYVLIGSVELMAWGPCLGLSQVAWSIAPIAGVMDIIIVSRSISFLGINIEEHDLPLV